MKDIKTQKLKKISILLFWLLLWELAARITDNRIILVGPIESLSVLFSMLPGPLFWRSVLNTLVKIMSGFLLSAISALLLGALAYFHPLIRDLLDPVISLMRSIPVASFVILALIWLGGSSELSIVVSFIVVFPMIWETAIGGLMSSDPRLLELSKVYGMGLMPRLRYIYIPALLPYLLSALPSVIGMAWKSGVAAELIGQPKDTIGFYLYQSKIFLDTAGLFAWTFTVIVLSYLSEKLIKLLIERIERRL